MCIKSYLDRIQLLMSPYDGLDIFIVLFKIMDETIDIWYYKEYLNIKFKNVVIKKLEQFSRETNKLLTSEFFTILDTILVKIGRRCHIRTKVKGIRCGRFCKNKPNKFQKCEKHYKEYLYNNKIKQTMTNNIKLYIPPVITNIISEYCE